MYFPIIDVLKENFIAKIPSIVTQWLTDNVDPVGSAVVVDTSLSISGAAADAKVTGDEIGDLKSDLDALDEATNEDVFVDENTFTAGKFVNATSASIGQNWSDLLTTNSGSDYLPTAIDLSGHIGDTLKLTVNGKGSTSTRAMGFCNSNGVISSVFVEKDLDYGTAVDGKYTVSFPITDTHFFFSFSRVGTYEARQIKIIGVEDAFKKRVLGTTYSKAEIDAIASGSGIFYISPTGADTNSGTEELPLATVNKALEKGASTVKVLNGAYYQNIDLSKLKGQTLEICSATPTGKAVFYEPNCVVATSESAESGYTKVYKCFCDATFDSNNNTIFQDNVSDTTTIISDAERHPLQRGQEYRCMDTAIKKCSSATLADALTEIESATSYKFFYDLGNDTLYFSRPQPVDSSHPICMSVNGSLFINRSERKSIKAVGIVAKYQMFNVSSLINPVMIDCAVKNAYGSAGFLYTQALGAYFLRCEATRIFSGGNGDGFNGHATASGETFGKQITATLVDCWAHDITDDGYSDHERSETTIIGGLFEYCGKGGITPSYGSHCTCQSVYSRKNSYNFYYTGEATVAEGGKYGQLICYNCVAEANNYSSGAGFCVDGTGNKLTLVGCKAIGNQYAYKAGANTTIELIDCKNGGNISGETSGIGTITTKL